ncbi:MAG: hypothetical protein ABIT20_06300 [Gemmatimonadaceae bacterium]
MRDLAPWQMEVFKSLLSLGLLAMTWVVGQRIIASWELRKKRNELDVAAAERFQQLYGELKEVARLWRSAKRPKGDAPTLPDGLQWDLVARATSAESKYETLVIKLSTERRLTASQIKTLGLFRQAVQEVRDSIRKGEIVPASGLGGEYLAFNDLAAEVTCLVGTSAKRSAVGGEVAQQNLQNIALVRKREWHAMALRYEQTKLVAIIGDDSQTP